MYYIFHMVYFLHLNIISIHVGINPIRAHIDRHNLVDQAYNFFPFLHAWTYFELGCPLATNSQPSKGM
jgi:hypothetical protein